MSPIQLTAPIFGHLPLRYGRLKVLESLYSVHAHYYNLEGLDGADGTQASRLDSVYLTHGFWNSLYCIMNIVKGRLRMGCKRSCLDCSEHSCYSVFSPPCVVCALSTFEIVDFRPLPCAPLLSMGPTQAMHERAAYYL